MYSVRTVDAERGSSMNLLQLTLSISCILVTLAVAGPATRADSERRIDVDVKQVKGALNRAFRFSVGSDRAIIHLRPEHQRDLRFVKDTCGFEYMRFHGLLNEEMQVVKRSPAGEIS